MPDIFFYIFSALALACGLMVILSRNPVNSAMFLVLSIMSLAGLFVLLHAFFLAAVQVIVYAGAVIILFIFVIMLLDLKEEQRRKINAFGAVTGILSVFAIGCAFWRAFSHSDLPPLTQLAGNGGEANLSTISHNVITVDVADLNGSARQLGKLLFTNYLLPFEILSILLLVAMVGVILLSKRDLK